MPTWTTSTSTLVPILFRSRVGSTGQAGGHAEPLSLSTRRGQRKICCASPGRRGPAPSRERALALRAARACAGCVQGGKGVIKKLALQGRAALPYAVGDLLTRTGRLASRRARSKP